MDNYRENCIEWITGADTICCSISQGKIKSKIYKLRDKYPDKVKIVAENKDGSMCATLPLSALKLSIIERSFSDEQLEAMKERFKK